MIKAFGKILLGHIVSFCETLWDHIVTFYKIFLSLIGIKKPGECDPLVFNFGSTIFVTHTISVTELNEWVRAIAKDSGQRVDWSYVGGRAVIQVFGNYKKAIRSLKKLRFQHDQYYRNYMATKNQQYECCDTEGNPTPFYREDDIRRQITGIWEYNGIRIEDGND